MNMVSVSVNDDGIRRLQIKPMEDHYAILENEFAIGVIVRSPIDQSNSWSIKWFNGKIGMDYIPLSHAMQEALK